MKALSIKQPFAELIRNGSKTIETRKWKTSYRGDILICSSISKHDGYVKYKDFVMSKKLLDKLPNIAYGYAICVASLTDVRPMVITDEVEACCPIYDGAYSWLLSNVRQIRAFPIKGQLSLFNVNDDLIDYL